MSRLPAPCSIPLSTPLLGSLHGILACRPMRPRLLALDLDGTLLTEDCQLPMGHALAVQEIRRLGVQVAIATGRGLMTSRLPWEQIGGIGPLVCFNGGWIGH